jgi:hypothetical protein
MFKKIQEIESREVSRRSLIKGAGTIAAGAALFCAGGAVGLKKADASGAKYPWPYVKLDPKTTADIAYENWYQGFCSYAVTSAILGQLQQKVGSPYDTLPIEAFSFGHGGTVGWGTLCGTLFGAGISASFAAGKTGEQITNDVIAWYAATELPTYRPASPKANFQHVSASDSPLCHISVGKWMKKENVKFFSPERKDRCARLAADVAAHTVTLLNQVADGTYTPAHGNQAKTHQITSQNNCTDCHGNNVPELPGT